MSGLVDLTGFAEAARAQAVEAGLPPRMKLADILPDPDNPRTPFRERSLRKQQEQLELNADIAERGVKNPISLRPHPTIPGKWMINAGQSRYEGAEAAGHADIPYFIDRDFDSFDQVRENELRSGLTPFELAAFIQRKMTEGMSKGTIATELRKKNQNFVTECLALIDPPACVVSAYAAGVESPRTLYDLRKAHEAFPEQFDSWCASGAQITRDTIKALLNALRSSQPEPQLTQVGTRGPSLDGGALVHDQVPKDEGVIAAQSVRGGRDMQQRAAASEAARQATTAMAREYPRDGRTAPIPGPAAEGEQEFRHDEKAPPTASRDTGAPSPVKARNSNRGIAVQYRGQPATLQFDTIVKIVVEGHDMPLEVAVSELVFERG